MIRRVVFAAALAGVVLLPGGPVHADGGHADVTAGDAAEAWYASAPVPPASVYPADTLHVGVLVGSENARTYVVPDFSGVPEGGVPVSGTMTLPVSTTPTAGNQNAATAQIVACMATAPFTDGASGSTNKAPATDCTVTAKANYVASPGSFTIDLAPFLQAWSQGKPRLGIALLPAPGQAPTTTWHVAFNGRKLPASPHVSSSLRVTPAGAGAAAPAPASDVPTAGVVAPDATVPVGSLDAGPPPAPVLGPSLAPAAVAAPQVAAAPSANQTVRSQPAGTFLPDLGFQYPEVMLLPLAFLVGLVFLVRTFTSDATPRNLPR
jgi:hypothetical protein